MRSGGIFDSLVKTIGEAVAAYNKRHPTMLGRDAVASQTTVSSDKLTCVITKPGGARLTVNFPINSGSITYGSHVAEISLANVDQTAFIVGGEKLDEETFVQSILLDFLFSKDTIERAKAEIAGDPTTNLAVQLSD